MTETYHFRPKLNKCQKLYIYIHIQYTYVYTVYTYNVCQSKRIQSFAKGNPMVPRKWITNTISGHLPMKDNTMIRCRSRQETEAKPLHTMDQYIKKPQPANSSSISGPNRFSSVTLQPQFVAAV